jgi:hypothetical protein
MIGYADRQLALIMRHYMLDSMVVFRRNLVKRQRGFTWSKHLVLGILYDVIKGVYQLHYLQRVHWNLKVTTCAPL